ncbi:hypothetical protein WOC36_20530 [Vibrio parahaemolyticus]|nr:hypothetical protein [Vibrio parahaemolyticus]EGQ8165743.1 hypothetical protein [Vibrio parahaemolyticus]EIV8665461.1 hypothetical protein [Vibrio parahaemolyticus]EJG0040103.1 hypothetical protein [Vibrio parahaemolyticus]MBA5880688.1 hypothetical protein [Vibrio parahaemolyticus]MBA5884947.1 hypothetical protein [Vibrio parahaemolyticus]
MITLLSNLFGIMAIRHSAQAVDTVSTSRSVLVNVAAPNRFDNIQNGRVT